MALPAILLGACNDPAGDILAGGGLDSHAWAGVARQAQQSVLRVNVETCDGRAQGSSFVIGRHELVTNAHVMEGATGATLDVPDGSQDGVSRWSAQSRADLSLVHTDGPTPTALQLADADPVPGDQVRAIGYPLGGALTVTSGRVIEYVDGDRYGYPGRLIRTSVAIRPGNSGGPLIDTRGRVVGVVSAVQLADGVALAIPVSQLRAGLPALEGGSPQSPATC